MNDLAQALEALSPVKRTLLLRRLSGGPRPESAPPRLDPRVRSGGHTPLSFAQQRMWLLQRLDPASVAYHCPLVLGLEGRLEVGALRRALGEIVRRHESLRTTFETHADQVRQVVQPPFEVPLPVFDLRGQPHAEREAAARAAVTRAARRPFDLEHGPLLRACLARLDDTRNWLLVCLHHLVADGWSIGVLTRELAELYGAFVAGRPSPLPDLPVQYGDYAAWQRERLHPARLEAALAWWRERLAGAPPVLELPLDHPRPAVPTSRGATHVFDLSAALSEGLERLAQAERATLFMVLLAGLDAWLGRHTGQDDVVVGTPVADRERAELAGSIGLFVNTLALRARLAGDPPFIELLRRVREETLNAFAHQELPFEKLVEALNPERQPSVTPIFQVMFVLHNADQVAREAGGVSFSRPLDLDSGSAQFDLTLSVSARRYGLAVAFEYNRDLFEAATVERLAERYVTLLEGIVRDPGRRLSELPLLSADERARLRHWSGAGAPAEVSPEAVLPARLAAACARFGPRVAVECGSQRLTYADLGRRAHRLARFLARHGIRRGHVVALHLERSVHWAVGLVGSLESGAAYLPLDPAAPPERVHAVLRASGARLLITSESLRGELGRRPPVEVLSIEDPALAIESDTDPHLTVGLDDLAYVIYTSGSSGVPKGVQLTHRGLAHHAVAISRRYGLGTGDRVMQFTSLGFDVAAEELFPALCCGATLVMRPRTQAPSFVEFDEFITRERVSVLNLPSAYWEHWAAELVRSGRTLPDSLRLVVVGTDNVAPASLAAWHQHFGARVTWLNAYGLTEAAITSTVYEGSSGFTGGHAVPIGRPLPGMQACVLDRELREQPIGVAGELYVGGPGLARGYLGRPERTAQLFLPNPFGAPPGSRLYRTGDRARWRCDGQLELLGREDRQVKVRGFRVELGEVEAVLKGHPDVEDAAVVLRKERGQCVVVAYIVAVAGVSLGEPAVRTFLAEHLPDYMLPAALLFVDHLPLNANGKVDRRALAERPAAVFRSSSAQAAPCTRTEEQIAATWREVLGLDSVSRDDNFFELGGHSLSMLSVHARLEALLGQAIAVIDLFRYPTVSAVAHHLDSGASGLGASAGMPPDRPQSALDCPAGFLPAAFQGQPHHS